MNAELIQKQLTSRTEFWEKELGWPNDDSSYVFLGRALHAMGKSMFGADWSGDEPSRDLMRELSVIPDRSGWRARFAHDLLVKHHPEMKRPARKPMQHSFEFTGKEWMTAVMIVKKHNEAQMPGFKRFCEARDRIIQLAEAGLLITAIRAKAGGDPKPIGRDWWNSERIRDRFDLCQLNPDDRYGWGIAGEHYQWIFVTRESLMSCAPGAFIEDAQASKSAATQLVIGSPPEEQTKPQRRLAAANIEPEFRRWRELQTDGYIPTADEDIAHMEQLGVSREMVRKLRKKFPTRARGEKKSS